MRLRKVTTALGLTAGLTAATLVAVAPEAQAEDDPADMWVGSEPDPDRVADGLEGFDLEGGVDPFILGGSAVDGNQYPWSVFLVVSDGSGASVCGGTLIRNQWILTAAHCVYDKNGIVPASWVHASIGGPNRPTSLTSRRFKRAAEVYVHMDYNPFFLRSDIALIKLRRPVRNAKTLPVAAPRERSTRKGGNMVTVAGWGIVKPGGRGIPLRQQKATIPLRTKRQCRNDYSGYRHNVNLCAGWTASEANKPQGSCQGDSGSALFAYTEYGPTQIGIVSFGFGDCTSLARFGYYTRVDTFRRDIVDLVNRLPSTPRVPRCSGRKATMTGTNGADLIVGTNKADVIVTIGGDDVVEGRNGNDVICLGKGNDEGRGNGGSDRVLGDRGNDSIRGGSKSDYLHGGPGSDVIRGEQGADTINGGPGNDDLFGQDGPDEIYGAGNNDHLDGGPSADFCSGGKGTDTATACETQVQIP